MVAMQEQLDWIVYRLFGLTTLEPPLVPTAPEDRVFLKRSDSAQDAVSRELVTNRIVGRLETPMYKRPWGGRDVSREVRRAAYEKEYRRSLRSAVLDNAEAALRQTPKALSARTVRDAIDHTLHNFSVVLEYLGTTISDSIASMLSADAVPFLSALRYSVGGLRKRDAWEVTWAGQRREDAGVGPIPPTPPPYVQKDFLEATFWKLRGEFDLPKERFIAYANLEKDDGVPLFGWAGWDFLERATALAALFHERKTEDGWGADALGRGKLVPILAGLLELIPWLKQWHNEASDDFGGEGAGDWYERYVEAEARSIGRTLDDLRAWRPEAGRRRA
jgi:hypothetical protein